MNLLEVCVKYPDIEGEMVLRISDDWDVDIPPAKVSEDQLDFCPALPLALPLF